MRRHHRVPEGLYVPGHPQLVAEGVASLNEQLLEAVTHALGGDWQRAHDLRRRELFRVLGQPTFFVTDSHLQTDIQLGDWDSFLRSLKAAGIDHVIISAREFNPRSS